MQSKNLDGAPRSGSPTQKLASVLLNQDVREFIEQRRSQGMAWRFIARDLYEATEHQIDVTYETVRSWAEDEAA